MEGGVKSKAKHNDTWYESSVTGPKGSDDVTQNYTIETSLATNDKKQTAKDAKRQYTKSNGENLPARYRPSNTITLPTKKHHLQVKHAKT